MKPTAARTSASDFKQQQSQEWQAVTVAAVVISASVIGTSVFFLKTSRVSRPSTVIFRPMLASPHGVTAEDNSHHPGALLISAA